MSSLDCEADREMRLDVRLRFYGREDEQGDMAESALRLLRSQFPYVEMLVGGMKVHLHDWYTGEVIA